MYRCLDQLLIRLSGRLFVSVLHDDGSPVAACVCVLCVAVLDQ